MSARILIAEDHPSSLELMCYLLTASGYWTVTATDGEAAIAAARRELPDLIVCDVQMPRIDGYEVLRRLKGDPALREIPIIAVTAFSMPGDRQKAITAGFDGYFSKPIDPAAFVAQMETFLPPEKRSASRRGG